MVLLLLLLLKMMDFYTVDIQKQKQLVSRLKRKKKNAKKSHSEKMKKH